MSPTDVLLALASVSPSPGATELPATPNPALVTPGTAGFIAIFVVALALVVLVRDMTRRVRRIKVRGARADEELRRRDAAAQERPADDGGQPGPGAAGEAPRRDDQGPQPPR